MCKENLGATNEIRVAVNRFCEHAGGALGVLVRLLLHRVPDNSRAFE